MSEYEYLQTIRMYDEEQEECGVKDRKCTEATIVMIDVVIAHHNRNRRWRHDVK